MQRDYSAPVAVARFTSKTAAYRAYRYLPRSMRGGAVIGTSYKIRRGVLDRKPEYFYVAVPRRDMMTAKAILRNFLGVQGG